MTVVVPCHKGDQHQAERLLKWISELGQVEARCVLFCAKDCNHPYLLSLAQCAFKDALWLEDRENIKSNWSDKTGGATSAAGPNSLFRQIAWYFYLPAKGPWLFLEPDCIPCTRDWYYKLKAEYEQVAVPKKKPFMGFRVDPKTHPGSLPVPIHMSGVGIYPSETPQLCPDAVRVSDAAFDVVGAKQMVPLMHNTQLLRHHYCAPPMLSTEEVDVRIPPSVVLYHADKTGSSLPFLRQRLGMEAPEQSTIKGLSTSPFPKSMVVSSTFHGSVDLSGPVVDIFIKTHAADHDWLEWCLKSIQKYATGFNRIVLMDTDSFCLTNEWFLRSFRNKELPVGVCMVTGGNGQPGYLAQQKEKLYADSHSPNADFILFMDSDCVFTKPVKPQDFIRDRKPIWLKTPFGNAREDQQVWKPIMAKFVGKEPQHEFMRRHPFCLPRWAFEELRNFCRYRHGMELADYIMAQAVPGKMLTFSEWNCAGFFLHEFHYDKVAWIDTTKDEVPEAMAYQGFTHAGEGRKQEDIAKFREILADDKPIRFCGISGTGTDEVESWPERTVTVQEAIEVLVREARKAHVCKGRVLTALKKAGLVKGGKLMELPDDPKPEPVKQEGVLLAIHTYPGGAETLFRHWPYYYLSGATRIVGIGTTDKECKWPVDCEHVNIGKDGYINGPHLPQRLIDTLEWCVKQPEDRYIIAEYDVLFLGGVPPWTGAMLHRTGGRPHDAKASQFFHNPWCLDRPTAKRLIVELKEIIREGHCKDRWPEASPDVALGFAVDRLKLDYTPMEHMFTRNSLEEPGALELALKAVREGATVIHGCKTQHAFDCLVSAHKGMKRKKAA